MNMKNISQEIVRQKIACISIDDFLNVTLVSKISDF